MTASYALVVETGETRLGPAALELLRAGIDVLHAGAPDEAWLLAQQERPNIHALITTPDVDGEDLDSLTGALRWTADEARSRGLVVGPRPDEHHCTSLRRQGLSRAVWEPFERGALRFLVEETMVTAAQPDRARGPRVPVRVPCVVDAGDGVHGGQVVSLSEHGAYLETALEFEAGASLSIEAHLPEGLLQASALVCYGSSGDPGRGFEPGCGVRWSELGQSARERLEDFLSFENERYRI